MRLSEIDGFAALDEFTWVLVAMRLSVVELDEALRFWKAADGAAPSDAEEAGGHPLRASEDEYGRPQWISCVGGAPVAIKLGLAPARKPHLQVAGRVIVGGVAA